MAIGPSPVSTPENLAMINENLAKLDHAEREVETAMRAGVHELPGGESIAQAKEQIKTLRSQLLRIKNVYFPGQ